MGMVYFPPCRKGPLNNKPNDTTMTESNVENQIVVCQSNETVRLDVRMKCCQCENDLTSVALAKAVASCQFQFPMKETA